MRFGQEIAGEPADDDAAGEPHVELVELLGFVVGVDGGDERVADGFDGPAADHVEYRPPAEGRVIFLYVLRFYVLLVSKRRRVAIGEKLHGVALTGGGGMMPRGLPDVRARAMLAVPGSGLSRSRSSSIAYDVTSWAESLRLP